MSNGIQVHLRTVGTGPTALVSVGQLTLVADRPATAGGGGLGFNGGQLMYASIAACVSNDLYREAATMGISLRGVDIEVDGDFPARGAPSTPITVKVRLESNADEAALAALMAEVDRVAEIPNSIRDATPIEIRRA